VALSGGSVPRGLYFLLATNPARREQAPWENACFFCGDEGHVPPDHPKSNFTWRMKPCSPGCLRPPATSSASKERTKMWRGRPTNMHESQ